MANKDEYNRYVCSYCGKPFHRAQEADACRDSHALLYIGITKEDLNRLLMFVRLKDDDLITDSLWRALNKPRRI